MKTTLASWGLVMGFFIILSSCHSADEKSNVIRTGFDEMKYWNQNTDAYTNQSARSGAFAIYAGANREFSLTWERKVDDLLQSGYSMIHSSIWVKCADSINNVQWVAAVNSPTGVNYLWRSCFISKCTYRDANGWRKAELEMELPLNAPDATLKLYGWSPNKEEVVLDDFELVLE